MQRIHNIQSLLLAEAGIPFDGNTACLAHISGGKSFAPSYISYLPTSTVMVIESSQTVKKIIETCLRSEGYPVISFTDSIEALTWLAQKTPSMPGLVLLDSNLSKMSRYKITRALKARAKGKKITTILLGCYDGIVDRLKGHMAGIKDYLPRPFTTAQVVELAHRYLNERMGVK